MEKFDMGEELGIILKWLTIVSLISGFLLRIVGIRIDYVLFLTIIFILLIVIYTQYRKMEKMKKEK